MPDNVHGASSHGDRHDRGHDTRSRLRELALQLFAEQGYEKTSLREIAERLGVTKAALYYYFKSKEEIVRSLVEDYMAELDELISWGKEQPRSADTRARIVRRYLDIVTNGAAVFRLLHQNQAVVSSLAAAKGRGELFRERMDALVDLLTEPDAPIHEQVRAASCLMSISFCCMHYQDRAASPAELKQAVLDVAFQLADATPAEAPA
ncbi:MAG TPA: TetR/AcrR family transcriptional regulator [Streptosporangiaceae bacterium]|jgi:AcrR family transcriptional regulator|nr:TetR/AcrR family transcriptional regulator [Streptosporangiaceae bacterium]